ncbi:UNKNOWN [Stylonychia lemnae]|uniref:Phosphoglycerate mutase family protein n=1 Tax=Stylonychia lemnae TaxID=5949 RepID=A0A078AKH5_STYLE|nr:UNKNOWN [Stylonychia lemnae]|eukprot:CDW82371.1 UNKNOWN [Stylonychia lemnae]
MMEYWFVRHGETKGNIDKIVQGWQPGELSQLGKDQAKIYVSDLKRTVDTAILIQEGLLQDKVPPLQLEMRLREKSAGIYEGQPLGSTSSAAKELGLDPRKYKPEGGESWLDLNQRIHSFLNETLKIHLNSKQETQVQEEQKDYEQQQQLPQSEEQPMQKILCVTHGGFITELLNVLQEFQGKEPIHKDKVRNCSIYVFRAHKIDDGSVHFESVIENDTSHLQ